MSSEETEAEAVVGKQEVINGYNKSDWSILNPTSFPGHFTNMRKREVLSKMDM